MSREFVLFVVRAMIDVIVVSIMVALLIIEVMKIGTMEKRLRYLEIQTAVIQNIVDAPFMPGAQADKEGIPKLKEKL